MRRERLGALDALCDHVRVADVPGLRVWRTLLPTFYSGDETMLPYVIVSVWTDAATFGRWKETAAYKDYAALLADDVADLDVRPPDVAIYRVTRMEVR